MARRQAPVESPTGDLAPELVGMTLNERLFSRGLIDVWDAAVRQRDRAAMRRILEQVALADPDQTIHAILADPARYGY